ncbi:hypothetical protein JOD55_001630 [Arcanobacterium pluranimalium]|nr:hypothetical protein [Arcanobacterium pluranimalium]
MGLLSFGGIELDALVRGNLCVSATDRETPEPMRLQRICLQLSVVASSTPTDVSRCEQHTYTDVSKGTLSHLDSYRGESLR